MQNSCHRHVLWLWSFLLRVLWSLFRNSFNWSVSEVTESILPFSFTFSNRLCLLQAIYYRKRGSASYIVREVHSVRERERDTERERERERDRRKWRHHCRAKLAMNLHFPFAKIRTIGDEFTLSLAKNSHLSFLHISRLSLHEEVTIVALKFAISSHFPLPKFFSPSLFPLFQMARAARRVIENPRQTIKSCPVLYCSSHRKTESN